MTFEIRIAVAVAALESAKLNLMPLLSEGKHTPLQRLTGLLNAEYRVKQAMEEITPLLDIEAHA